MGIFSALLGLGIILLVLVCVVVVPGYIAFCIFLNKFNKQVEGKGTAKAWIPVVNMYVLGKLLINKGFGWAILITQITISILTSTTTVTVNDFTTTTTILPEPISQVLTTIWGVVMLGLTIWAIVKYFRNKRGYSPSKRDDSSYFKSTKKSKTNEKVDSVDNLWGWKDSDSSKM